MTKRPIFSQTKSPHNKVMGEKQSANWIIEWISDTCFLLKEEAASESLIVKEKGHHFEKESQSGSTYLFDSKRLHVEFDGRHLNACLDGVISCSAEIDFPGKKMELHHEGPIYGLGDKLGPLDHRGHYYESWNTDPSGIDHFEQMPSLYKSINFLALFDPKGTFGIYYDNTSRCKFDLGLNQPGLICISHIEGCFRAYFFLGSLPQVTACFANLVGHGSLPPRWALGHQQCRFGYKSEQDYDQVIEGYRNADIPLSVIYLDIDYMDGFADFSVNPQTFPSIDQWVAKKGKEGIHVVPIIDCGVKALKGSKPYDEGSKEDVFCKQGKTVFHGEVWPGDSVFPAFLDEKCQHWWKRQIKNFVKHGFAGIWNDMNEPATFDGPFPDDVDMGGLPHRLARNVYAHFENKATYEALLEIGKRPFILTRAAFAGSAAYAGCWTGDNTSSWTHLNMMIPQLCNMALSGYSYCGVDIGGFKYSPTDELLARWAEAAILNPFYRNHTDHGRNQEGYRLKGKYLEAYRNAVNLHHQLIPYFYDCFYLHQESGAPLLRPLVYGYPNDRRTYQEDSELMFGDSLLLAPALKPGQSKRLLYLPDEFVEYQTGKLLKAGDHIIDCQLGKANLYVKKNSLIPMLEKENLSPKIPDSLHLYWSGGKARCLHYEDEGDGLAHREGKYLLLQIEMKDDGKFDITIVHQGMEIPYRKVVVEYPDHHLESFPFPI